MATTGNISVTGSLNNTGFSNEILDVERDFISGIYSVASIVLASGVNTVTVPAGTTFIIGQLPQGNAVVTTLKLGGSGDTGAALAPDGGLFLIQITSASPITSFVLNSASDQSQPTVIKFI